jgi:hypothetical protein
MSAQRPIALPIVLALVQGQARADDREWRLSLAPQLGAVFATSADVGGTGFEPGGRLRIGRGVTDYLELAFISGFTWTSKLNFQNAQVQSGNLTQSGNLVGDFIAVEVGAGMRLIGDLPVARRFFARNHPFLDVRGGLLVKILKSPQLLDPGTGNIVLDRPTQTTPTGFVAVGLGLEHRFVASWLLGIVAEYVYAPGYQRVGAAVEVSWCSY